MISIEPTSQRFPGGGLDLVLEGGPRIEIGMAMIRAPAHMGLSPPHLRVWKIDSVQSPGDVPRVLAEIDQGHRGLVPSSWINAVKAAPGHPSRPALGRSQVPARGDRAGTSVNPRRMPENACLETGPRLRERLSAEACLDQPAPGSVLPLLRSALLQPAVKSNCRAGLLRRSAITLSTMWRAAAPETPPHPGRLGNCPYRGPRWPAPQKREQRARRGRARSSVTCTRPAKARQPGGSGCDHPPPWRRRRGGPG